MRFTQLLGLATFLAISSASVISEQPQRRDVWAPRILYPNAQTTWRVKEFHNVTWDLSSEPTQITNPIGRILIRQGGFTFPVLLQDIFDLRLGRIEVQVPWVLPGQYQLNLFGDSGTSPRISRLQTRFENAAAR
ncbi:hypothetical protein BDN72DRAFT_856210 [Pluteus cervinus]|uniref:Uncharacterized protein n=1 Tax=Pluteus cervinus TaxID=181527 RepID=A0ACD3AZI4_9AGAR|nr:hypothetical protein BDN72DRAFT_856210 [Pluteus cervinus]